MCHCLDLQLVTMATSETDLTATFQAYRTLTSEVNALQHDMSHLIEKKAYVEQILTALALTTINNQEELAITGIPEVLDKIKAKIRNLVSTVIMNSLDHA